MILISYLHLDQRNRVTQRERDDLLNIRLGQLPESEIAPLFSGFCGDFVPGVEQIHCPRAGPGPVGPRVGPARPY